MAQFLDILAQASDWLDEFGYIQGPVCTVEGYTTVRYSKEIMRSSDDITTYSIDVELQITGNAARLVVLSKCGSVSIVSKPFSCGNQPALQKCIKYTTLAVEAIRVGKATRRHKRTKTKF